MSERNASAALERTIERYNDAWNAHDVDAIVALHAPGMVFENHTAGERVEGEAVRGAHRADLRELARPRLPRSPAVRARRSRRRASGPRRRPTLGPRLEWDGVDVFPFEDGLITRKDVYSSSHAPRVLGG